MYQGMPTTSNSQPNRGVEICVEGTQWRIKEIGYDGVERYVPRPTFKSLVAKNAELINWREVVGREASLDRLPSTSNDEADDETDRRIASQLVKVEQTAGPWAGVQRFLRAAMIETDRLLDILHLLKTEYMTTNTVVPIVDDQKTQDQIASSKSFQFYFHKKALSEAAILLGERGAGDANATSLGGNGAPSTATIGPITERNNAFFAELRKMRENWRVRKMNDAIFGDLGYRIYEPKYVPAEMFDVLRNEQIAPQSYSLHHQQQQNYCAIQVKVPLHLARRSMLDVSVFRDSDGCAIDFFEQEFKAVDENSSRMVHWMKALKWAQNSLICNDILSQLIRDCLPAKLICTTTKNSIVLKLFGDMMMKVSLKHYPFQDGDLPEHGILYLNHMLLEIFIADYTQGKYRSQQFIQLNQTILPENLDFRAAQGLSAREISSRTPISSSLLARLVDVTNHYVLVEMVLDAIQKHFVANPDPVLQFKFIRSSTRHSMLSLTLVNRYYEQLGKFSMFVRIFFDNVVVQTKEGQYIHCRREMNLFRNALQILTANYQLQTTGYLVKQHAWQVLHANANALDVNGVAAPSMYLCNQTSTKQLFLQFPSDERAPLVHIKAKSKAAAPMTTTPGRTIDDQFRRVFLARLPGGTFLHKMDSLLLAFSK